MTKLSKFLSLVLRHKPDEIGISLDSNGWTDIDELIIAAERRGVSLTRDLIEKIVSENDKKRFAISDDSLRIRANQGHSVEIDLGLTPSVPPEFLFHGTALRFLDSIRADGLHSAKRQHVHLSSDRETAMKVGQRHGSPIVLIVRAGEMSAAGSEFFLSENGVWLTERVPARFLKFPD